MCIIVLVLYRILTRCWLKFIWVVVCTIATTESEPWRGIAWLRLKPHMMWCMVGWFLHLSHLMTRVSKVSEGTAHDDRSYWSFIHERLFRFCLLIIFRIGKPPRLIYFVYKRLLVFYESGRDKHYILASNQFSLAQTSFHTTCIATRVSRPGSCFWSYASKSPDAWSIPLSRDFRSSTREYAR
jgi:hypothetical protein